MGWGRWERNKEEDEDKGRSSWGNTTAWVRAASYTYAVRALCHQYSIPRISVLLMLRSEVEYVPRPQMFAQITY